jgi:hypothetical protein
MTTSRPPFLVVTLDGRLENTFRELGINRAHLCEK